MNQSKAQSAIVNGWMGRRDKSDSPTESDMFVYFAWIEQNRPDLLSFRYAGDKWQKVHAWLNDCEQQHIKR